MKLKFLFLFFLCAYFFNALGQVNTTYFFLGNVYSVREHGLEKRYPYLPVYLSLKEKPDEVIAVGMTDAVGTISFKGTPMDIAKAYIFTLPLPDRERKFVFNGIPNPLFKSGNVTVHTRIDEESKQSYFERKVLQPEKADEDKKFAEWLRQQNVGIECEGNNFFDKESERSFRIMFNGVSLPADKTKQVLGLITMGMIKNVFIVQLTLPDDNFAGAIDIRLIEGEVPTIKTTTFSLDEL
ncbi:MAG: hypothetical protein ACFNQF_03540 [Bacteroides sp.]